MNETSYKRPKIETIEKIHIWSRQSNHEAAERRHNDQEL